MPERDRRSPLPADAQRQSVADARLTEALRDCGSGDVTAFRELYQLAAPRVLGVLVQRLGDRDAAELALQDSMLRIWQQAKIYRPETMSPGEWLERFLPPKPPAGDDFCPAVRPDESTLGKILASVDAGQTRRRSQGLRQWGIFAAILLGMALLMMYLGRR